MRLRSGNGQADPQLVWVDHACEMFVSLRVGEERFTQIANKDKGAGDDGEGKVGLGDEVRDVLLEGKG